MGHCRKILVGQSLLEKFPGIAAQTNGWDPAQVTFQSAKKLPWKCTKDPSHIWDARVYSRTRENGKGSGCPICLNKKIIPGKNDLATVNPELAKQADGWNSSQVSPNSSKKMPWVCPKDNRHKWTALISSRLRMGPSCPVCSHQKIIPGVNDLKTLRPDVASMAYGWDPSQVASRSVKEIRMWQCPKNKNHIWKSSVSNITRLDPAKTKTMGCPYCSNRIIIPGENDLATTHPELAKELISPDPKKISYGSGRKCFWQCQKNQQHKYWMVLANRTSLGQGCPNCQESGFCAGKPGFLYLLQRPGQFKIGITNHLDDRVGKRHKRNGWELIDSVQSLFGSEVRELESVIKTKLREHNIPTGPDAFREKFDGWTEAFQEVDLPIKNLKDLFKQLKVNHSCS